MVVCFDLDGTICDTDESLPVPDRYYRAKVKESIRDLVNRLHSKGHTIIIDTARTSGMKGLKNILNRFKIKRLTIEQLKLWDVHYHKLRIGVKFPANLYIDDKCLPVSYIERDK